MYILELMIPLKSTEYSDELMNLSDSRVNVINQVMHSKSLLHFLETQLTDPYVSDHHRRDSVPDSVGLFRNLTAKPTSCYPICVTWHHLEVRIVSVASSQQIETDVGSVQDDQYGVPDQRELIIKSDSKTDASIPLVSIGLEYTPIG